jgi:hypothetical protein
MVTLNWNEIKTRASAFILEWNGKAGTAREEADAHTFENGFFNIFGVKREKVATFEKKVRLKDGFDTPDLFGNTTSTASGYIDLFWEGHILIEMKTPGKDLSDAYEQARRYAASLTAKELPKGILICDFVNFHYYDLTHDAECTRFTLAKLADYVELFGYLAGYNKVTFKELDPVNIEAAEKMSRLHNRLSEIGYSGHPLEVYLVRILFCLFADDTGIFEHKQFLTFIIERTNPDGSDLALHLAKLFEVLNKPKEARLKTIDEQLNGFPYVNGGLFEEHIETADFDSKMRETLIDCCNLDWSLISPAIFGSLFQGVMKDDERHDIGAHYTSEKNILKLIHPLFLDDLWAEFEKIKAFTSEIRKERLTEFHTKLSKLTFLDPACGCGNFLVISYRELRLLEMNVIKELLGDTQLLDVDLYIKINVNQFYGIEIEEFPAKIAQTALWLMDHQMNMQVREQFGQYFRRIPLKASATIVNGNALTLDWESIVKPAELSYILGNPPFLGKKYQTPEQKSDIHRVLAEVSSGNSLDFVTCWYLLAAQYIQKNPAIEVAFVSTNSITQGEQVAILWQHIFNRYGVFINFAHNTFKWSNEAKGVAAVYCVIIGFSKQDKPIKKLFTYADIKGDATEMTVKHINGYLTDGPDVWIASRTNPLSKVPSMVAGNKPVDYNHLKIEGADYQAFIEKDPLAKNYIKRMIGADEFINNLERYCLWLVDCPPEELRKMPEVMKRVEACREARLKSVDSGAQNLADTPTVFRETMNPASYLVIPGVSSERRKYIPIGFCDADTIPVMGILIVPEASIYHFGVLTSTMHMAWMRAVCGRLKSDYRYSKDIVYNNFPWPTPTEDQKHTIETTAQAILDARTLFPKSSLADLYDPTTMPPELTKAHKTLDAAVEKAYGREFAGEPERVAHLFELYQQLSGELAFAAPKKRGKGRKI